MREQIIRLHLDGEIREVGGQRKAQRKERPENKVGEEKFGVAGVNKDSAKDEPSDQDDCTADVGWAGLHHVSQFTIVSFQFSLQSAKRGLPCSLVVLSLFE